MQELEIPYKQNFGYQFFMIFVFLFLSFPTSLAIYSKIFEGKPIQFDGTSPIFLAFGSFFLFACLFTLKEFILDIFVPKTLTLKINEDQIIWEEKRKNNSVNYQDITRDHIKEINIEISYYLGNYNYFRFCFIPKNENHMTEVISGNPLKSILEEDEVRRIFQIFKNYGWSN